MKRLVWFVVLLTLALFGATTFSGSLPAAADGGGGTSTRVELTGPALNGRIPDGRAEFRIDGARRGFKVQVEDVNLPGGTRLAVRVNGATVGSLRLTVGRGEMELRSQDGATVPAIRRGDVVTVVAANGSVVVSGHF